MCYVVEETFRRIINTARFQLRLRPFPCSRRSRIFHQEQSCFLTGRVLQSSGHSKVCMCTAKHTDTVSYTIAATTVTTSSPVEIVQRLCTLLQVSGLLVASAAYLYLFTFCVITFICINAWAFSFGIDSHCCHMYNAEKEHLKSVIETKSNAEKEHLKSLKLKAGASTLNGI